MKSRWLPAITAFLGLSTAACAQVAPPAGMRVASPDGKVVAEFIMLTGGVPAYRVTFQGKPMLLESRLGLEPDFKADFVLDRVESSQHKGEWTQKFGERKIVPDNYHELDVDLKHRSNRPVRIALRAYNEGAAWRYEFPMVQQDKEIVYRFNGEHTEFRLPEGTFAYEEHGTEGDYQRVKVDQLQPQCERPLTLEYASGLFGSVLEADNERYPRMLLSRAGDPPGTLVSRLGGTTLNLANSRQPDDPSVTMHPGEATPWRVLMVGEKPGDLLEHNYLVQNLNPPCAIADTSWIRPGKAMRDAALTTASAKAIIDLAPKLGLDYVGFDAHWYGPNDAGDATQVRVPNLDIREVVQYAKAHGVAVCAYVDGRQIKLQRDALFKLFKDWGVDAMKIGFVAAGPQAETAWITDVISRAAQNRLVLDIHDGYRPTGNNRTWPNLLTIEGIQGNEHHPTAAHNCTLPFTRYLVGPGDYTVCYMDTRNQTTHAHQLAMGVVSFSPMQWLYWYDRPDQYREVPPELEFFVHMPTVWDETRVINGKIGEYATVARRSGDDWFIGTINGTTARALQVPLAFLEAGKKYTAHLYSDDDAAVTRTKVKVETRPVDATTTLEAALQPNGGQAVRIEKLN